MNRFSINAVSFFGHRLMSFQERSLEMMRSSYLL